MSDTTSNGFISNGVFPNCACCGRQFINSSEVCVKCERYITQKVNEAREQTARAIQDINLESRMDEPKEYIGIKHPISYMSGHNDHLLVISQKIDDFVELNQLNTTKEEPNNFQCSYCGVQGYCEIHYPPKPTDTN